MATSSYEFHTVYVHADSDENFKNEVSNTFISQLIYPLKDVVQVSILTAEMNVVGNAISHSQAYLSIEELQSQFNQIAGIAQSNVIGLSYTRSAIKNPIAVFNLNNDNRTIYEQNDYSTQTQFISPIRKLERLTCKLYNGIGEDLVLTTRYPFFAFRFTCLRSNLCPEPPKRKKR